MQDEIEIIHKDNGYFGFFHSYKKVYLVIGEDVNFCKVCKSKLASSYSYIINRLRENNLLPKDYEMLCCFCAVIKKR